MSEMVDEWEPFPCTCPDSSNIIVAALGVYCSRCGAIDSVARANSRRLPTPPSPDKV